MNINSYVKAKQIGAFLLLSFIISTATVAISYIESVAVTKKEVEARLLAETRRLAIQYENWIARQLAGLQAISEYVEMNYSPEMYRTLTAAAINLEFNSMAPADRDGILHLAGGKTADLSQRDYLQKV